MKTKINSLSIFTLVIALISSGTSARADFLCNKVGGPGNLETIEIVKQNDGINYAIVKNASGSITYPLTLETTQEYGLDTHFVYALDGLNHTTLTFTVSKVAATPAPSPTPVFHHPCGRCACAYPLDEVTYSAILYQGTQTHYSCSLENQN